MRPPALRVMVWLCMTACNLDNPFDTPQPPCEDRTAWYADSDDDGVGDIDGEVLITCEPPGDGWTDVPPDDESDDTDDTDGSG